MGKDVVNIETYCINLKAKVYSIKRLTNKSFLTALFSFRTLHFGYRSFFGKVKFLDIWRYVSLELVYWSLLLKKIWFCVKINIEFFKTSIKGYSSKVVKPKEQHSNHIIISNAPW